MNFSTKGNMYTSGQDEARALFDAFIAGSTDNLLCAVASRELDAAAQEALNSTAEALGYGANAFTFVTLSSDGIELDPISLFTLLEGIDPLLVVFADDASRTLAETAYRCSIASHAESRLFGRPAVAFQDFSAMLATQDGKQRAWSLLKTLPKRS